MSFEAYTYNKKENNVYRYFRDTDNQYQFRLQYVSDDIAVIQFLDTYYNQMTIPNGFTVVDDTGLDIPPFQNAFYITWIHSYKLNYYDMTIWSILTQKQQTVVSCNSANILQVRRK